MTNALAEAIDADLEVARDIRCKTCITLRALTDEERKTFDLAMASGIPLATIVRALQSLGHDVSHDSLLTHSKRGHAV